jgi:hypothetical protein
MIYKTINQVEYNSPILCPCFTKVLYVKKNNYTQLTRTVAGKGSFAFLIGVVKNVYEYIYMSCIIYNTRHTCRFIEMCPTEHISILKTNG